jgi:hypothetical protein
MLYVVRDHLFPVLVFLHALLAGAPPQDGHGHFARLGRRYAVTRLARLPAPIAESSGLARGDSAGLVWTHGDGGTAATLYLAGLDGRLRGSLPLAPLANHDWEELTRDPAGRFYIGDFGNNRNDRRDLAIYRVTPGAGRARIDTIAFRYPDQAAFPPPSARRHFDCEAMVFYHDTLHLFTKDRSRAHCTRYYVVPARPGRYVATLRDSLRLGTLVTGAALRPDGQAVALLGYGAMFVFAGPPNRRLFRQLKAYRRLPATGQAEGVVYLNDQDLLLSNERGRLFRATYRPKGGKPAGESGQQ